MSGTDLSNSFRLGSLSPVETTVVMNVRRYRLAAGLSRRELGLLSGCSSRSFDYWEHGERCPKVGELGRVAVGLGRPVTDFFVEAQ
jgi:transcriptional regulator with XRE-family HTH domain